METNYGRRNRPIRWLYLATRETYWRVNKRHAADRAGATTRFCAVVPRKHTFTLAGGIYTTNCGACEPECPVEAIFPEDALPTSGSRSSRSTTPTTGHRRSSTS